MRKTPANFARLQSEVVKTCPRWQSAKMALPVKKPSGLGALFSISGSNGSAEDSDEQRWDQCRNFVLQFVEDYTANESSPELKRAESGNDCDCGLTLAEHLRVSFRCLFFLQRDPDVDTYVVLGSASVFLGQVRRSPTNPESFDDRTSSQVRQYWKVAS